MSEKKKKEAPVTEEETPVTDPAEEAAAPEEPAPEEDKLASLQAELKEAQERILRIHAEYDNYKKRTAREKEELFAAASGEVVTKLLPVFDNLERAGACTDFESLKKGVDMILSSFKDCLSLCGVEEIAAEGAPFDPALHNAVLQEEREDMEENTVSAVLQKGYRLGDRVLRCAMVKVVTK